MEPNEKKSESQKSQKSELGKNKQLAVCKFCGKIGHSSRCSQYCKANINNNISKITENLTETTLANEINDTQVAIVLQRVIYN